MSDPKPGEKEPGIRQTKKKEEKPLFLTIAIKAAGGLPDFIRAAAETELEKVAVQAGKNMLKLGRVVLRKTGVTANIAFLVYDLGEAKDDPHKIEMAVWKCVVQVVIMFVVPYPMISAFVGFMSTLIMDGLDKILPQIPPSTWQDPVSLQIYDALENPPTKKPVPIMATWQDPVMAQIYDAIDYSGITIASQISYGKESYNTSMEVLEKTSSLSSVRHSVPFWKFKERLELLRGNSSLFAPTGRRIPLSRQRFEVNKKRGYGDREAVYEITPEDVSSGTTSPHGPSGVMTLGRTFDTLDHRKPCIRVHIKSIPQK